MLGPHPTEGRKDCSNNFNLPLCSEETEMPRITKEFQNVVVWRGQLWLRPGIRGSGEFLDEEKAIVLVETCVSWYQKRCSSLFVPVKSQQASIVLD